MSIREHPTFVATGLLALALTAGSMAQPAWAAFSQDFGLVDEFPDLFTDDLLLDYTYNAGDLTSILSITGTAATGGWRETSGSATQFFTSMSFDLEVRFADAGSVLTGGSVTITNTDFNQLDIDDNTLLLNAEIFDFAVDPASGAEAMFFKLRNTQSEAATELGWDVPRDGQIIFRFDSLAVSDWELGTVNLTDQPGATDTNVPSPATVALIGIGLIGLQWLRGRHRPRRTRVAGVHHAGDGVHTGAG